jgi:FPC/CPF motif-containing protein YcgG
VLYSLGQLCGADSSAPEKLKILAREFSSVVDNPDFPCIFSSAPFARQEIFFGASEQGEPKSVVALLKVLCSRIAEYPNAVGVLFVPQQGSVTIEDDFNLARRIVRSVEEQDLADGNAEFVPGAGGVDWRLRLGGIELFINFSSPRHRRRRSRNVGSCFTLVVQARASFDHPAFKSPRARGEIRRRLHSYDAVGPHPSLGDPSSPDDQDALHFFLGDGNQPLNVAGSNNGH